MNPFIDGEERFIIDVRYVKQKSGAIAIVRKANATNASTLSTIWRRLNYEQLADISSEALRTAPTGEVFVDWVRHRALILRTSLVGWNIEGIPCTPENIMKLDPEVASELIEQYMKITIPDREQAEEQSPNTEQRLANLESAVVELWNKVFRKKQK